MDKYPFNELADMHFIYGPVNGNDWRAAYLYQETFSH
jgi:hypothetical protein